MVPREFHVVAGFPSETVRFHRFSASYFLTMLYYFCSCGVLMTPLAAIFLLLLPGLLTALKWQMDSFSNPCLAEPDTLDKSERFRSRTACLPHYRLVDVLDARWPVSLEARDLTLFFSVNWSPPNDCSTVPFHPPLLFRWRWRNSSYQNEVP